MKKLKYLLQRFFSFATDYILILTYLVLLYLLTTQLNKAFQIQYYYENYYLIRHLTSFLFVTLPVVLYFIIMESSGYQGTIGKLAWGLKVRSVSNPENHKTAIIKRNIIKFLPWEMAHVAIHINPEFEFFDSFTGNLSLFLLITSQIAVIIYLLSIILDNAFGSIYDEFGKTSVMKK